MKYKISLYCPDSHILYDINTLDRKGVGGGITSRVRMAHALAALGHDVTLYVNCPKCKTIQGVRYIHYSQCFSIDADIFIASTSGGAFDLAGLQTLNINSRLKILMLHGVPVPHNVKFQDFDFIYFPSNFVKDHFSQSVDLANKQAFITYRGVESSFYKKNAAPRDPFSLVYLGHPEKGLADALAILRILRKKDPRFSLHVFGGYGLWGDIETSIPSEPGLVNHGLMGQKKLIPLLQKMNFSLNLQAIKEGFGLAVCESMRAGCIVLASLVGAYPEVINQGQNGFLIEGEHTDPIIHSKTSDLIISLMNQPNYLEFVRQNAINTPFTWQTIAKVWQDHWDWALSKSSKTPDSNVSFAYCTQCNGAELALADGFHCVNCGHYQQSLYEKSVS